MENYKIFVSIASYKDPELQFTVNNLFEKAQFPDRVFVGICQQDHPSKWINFDNSNIKTANFSVAESRGVCWARWQAHQFYNGENYFIQLDSHIDLTECWDTIVIEQIHMAESFGSKKCLMSVYPPAYEIEADGTRTRKPGNAISTGVQTACEWPIGHGSHIIHSSYPVSSPFINAGLMFGHGSFYIDCPYDPEIYFIGEEILNTLRAYTHGYDLYSPSAHIGWHLYKKWDASPEEKKNWALHWNEEDDRDREIKWLTLCDNSRAKVKKILSGQLPECLGRERTIADYERYIRRPILDPKGTPC